MPSTRKKEAFIIDRWKSLGFALKGFYFLIRYERSVQVHTFLFVVSLSLAFIFELTFSYFLILLLAHGLILTAEALNTAIERLCDFVHPEYHVKIGRIKDLSAGAVAFAALLGYAIIILIFIHCFKPLIFL